MNILYAVKYVSPRLRPLTFEEVTIREIAYALKVPTEEAMEAVTDGDKNEVLVLSKYVEEASLEKIVRTLILHFVALASGYSPSGNNFENALATELANVITPKRKAMTF